MPGPVQSVTAVVIEGATLDPAAYLVVSDSVQRIDGEPWPDFQDFTVTEDGVHGWGIQYRRGRPWPAGTDAVVGHYACQLYKAACGQPCEIPSQVTNIVRQGVTYVLDQPETLLNEGLTGVRIVDRWLRTWNPGKVRRPARSFRADRVHSRGRLHLISEPTSSS
jgi:hypothetical protein